MRKSKDQIFWKWFETNQNLIYEGIESNREQIFDDFENNLHKVDESLAFSISPKDKLGYRILTISADGMIKQFPKVEKLVNAAPENVKNWRIVAFRQRVPGDTFTISYQGYNFGYKDIFFKDSIAKNNLLDIDLFIKDYNYSGTMQNAVFILLDYLLGEYDATMKIKIISWEKLNSENKQGLKPIIMLREIINSQKAY